jgi:nitrogen fixation protein
VKRRNVQLAFEGEGSNPPMGAPDALVDGDEAIDIAVLGGKLMVVVPSRTPEERIFQDASMVGGELVLENGLRLSFEIKDEAVGALFSTVHVGDQADTHPGLSGLPHVPSGA